MCLKNPLAILAALHLGMQTRRTEGRQFRGDEMESKVFFVSSLDIYSYSLTFFIVLLLSFAIQPVFR